MVTGSQSLVWSGLQSRGDSSQQTSTSTSFEDELWLRNHRLLKIQPPFFGILLLAIPPPMEALWSRANSQWRCSSFRSTQSIDLLHWSYIRRMHSLGMREGNLQERHWRSRIHRSPSWIPKMVSSAGMPLLLRGSVLMKMMTVIVALVPLFLSWFLDPIEAKHLMYPTFDRNNLRAAEVGVGPPATSALAGHSKKKGRPEALPIGTPKSSGKATVAPWRPPVVNFQYQGGPVMTQPIKCIFIWYESKC